MKKPFFRSYLILGAFLFLSLCMPEKGSNLLRSGFVGLSIPLFKTARWIAHSSLSTTSPIQSQKLQEQVEKLQIENLTLRTQIDRMYAWLEQEEHLESITENERLSDERVGAVKAALQQQSQFLPARVVFREPASWSSFVWIDIGSCENKRIGFDLVAENSPVISGSALIGLVEYVGHNRSKVRLITDRLLTPAVTITNHQAQHRFLLDHIDPLVRLLPLQQHLFQNDDCAASVQVLNRIQEQIVTKDGSARPAKGFVEGLSEPLWRLGNQKLKGLGFFQSDTSQFNVGDLIQTSGLDGVFPAGLIVGAISNVDTIKKGDATYRFTVELAVANLDELATVHVIPPCRR